MRNFVIIIILVFLYSCQVNTEKIEIIKCEISLDSKGVIKGTSHDKNSVRTKTNIAEDISKFEEIYERVINDKRYKCCGHDYVIEIVKGNQVRNSLYVNTLNAGKNKVWIVNSNFNGYITITLKEWEDLLRLTD